MKYIENTAKTRMYIDKSTIYFNNGKQFYTTEKDEKLSQTQWKVQDC
jgi:hypothetical protein